MENLTKRTYQLANRIYKLCRTLQQDNDYTDKLLANQLFRSGTSTSIGGNTEEAYSAVSDKDFVNKLSIALKEGRKIMSNNYL